MTKCINIKDDNFYWDCGAVSAEQVDLMQYVGSGKVSVKNWPYIW